jgi:hypothetical protein
MIRPQDIKLKYRKNLGLKQEKDCGILHARLVER